MTIITELILVGISVLLIFLNETLTRVLINLITINRALRLIEIQNNLIYNRLISHDLKLNLIFLVQQQICRNIIDLRDFFERENKKYYMASLFAYLFY